MSSGNFIDPGNLVITPIVPSPTQLVQNMQQESNNLAFNIICQTKKYYDTIWNNSNYTPQQMFDALGQNATTAMNTYAATVQYINTICPGSIPPEYCSAGKPYTANPDGTITIL